MPKRMINTDSQSMLFGLSKNFLNMNILNQTATGNETIMTLLPSEDEFLTLKEAGSFLKVSTSTMQKISASRIIPVYKPGNGKVFFKKSDLLAYFNKGRQDSQQKLVIDHFSKLKKIGGANEN